MKTLAWESAGLVQEIRAPCALLVSLPASLELEASCFWKGRSGQCESGQMGEVCLVVLMLRRSMLCSFMLVSSLLGGCLCYL